ncbi:MAG: exodeoxyribonuclease III [Bdellovibrionales bacterium]|nr:exodeoxyribonuclease III [Bdellovibrionales bacterium]
MKIYSWNVNGYRAVHKNGFLEWLKNSEADVVCLQETKVMKEQLAPEQLEPLGYHTYWASAQKPGYSGVAFISKRPLENVKTSFGEEIIDHEGRFIETSFKDFDLISSYFPNSQREHTRLDYKLVFCELMREYLMEKVESGRNVVICGDFNIAHKEIDLKNPKSNQDNAGFLPEERAWMDLFLESGFVDGLRQFNTEPDQYTWWSYRPGVREKNIGWRIDYFSYNKEFSDRVKDCRIHANVMGSDHCPISLSILT